MRLAGVELSRALHWAEDGDHVIRSLEFDVLAADPDFDQALVKFVESLEDYADDLNQLGASSEGQEATADELEQAILVFKRFADGYREVERVLREEFERERRRRIAVHLRRPRQSTPRPIRYQRSSPPTSSRLQPV